MNKLFTLLIILLSTTSFSQNVGISTNIGFTPTELLHIDGNIKVGRVSTEDANIYLANKLYDMDNASNVYFLDPNATSRLNQIQFDDGSISTPSIYFEDDNNSGLYQPYDGSIGFTINGTEAIRISSSRKLVMNDNDITGLKQLHFNTGELYVNGDNGDAGQVLKSDGTNIYWDDLSSSSVTTDIISEQLVNAGEILWSHSDGVDVYINSGTEAITVNNNSGEEWVIYIQGKSSNNSVVTVSAISNDIDDGESVILDQGSQNDGGFSINAGRKYTTTESKGFIMHISWWSTRYSGIVTHW